MNTDRTARYSARFALGAMTATALCVMTGCVSPHVLSVQASAYHIDVRLDTERHFIEGTTVIQLTNLDDAVGPDATDAADQQPIAVDLLLHPDLRITSVTLDGRPLRHSRLPAPRNPDEAFQPRTHRVSLEDVSGEVAKQFHLAIRYHGKLFQDVSAGEEAGQIHNFEMRAHVGKDGIYLGGGYWYPEPARAEHITPTLADFTLVADRVAGMELVAGAQRDQDATKETSRPTWKSPYPLDGMVLVGGTHEVHEFQHGPTTIRLHLKASQADQAEGLAEAVAGYLDRYQPLIGAYPANEFAVVDNFFSSGFAFPTFTLLSSAVIDMGKRSQTAHGYIDHEVLHCWWGNGVHVDPEDGNWCEALASYGANYYGYVLDGKPEEARRKRRNYAHFLSRLKPESDKPLGTYGQEDGCGRGIAYNKGAAVFHMLARKIGQDTFWAVMRRFTDEYVGRYANWDDIRRLCEAESGEDLTTFFRQWVRSGGAPKLNIESARYNSADSTLTMVISQGEPAFDLSIPVRVTYAHAAGAVDVPVALSMSQEEVTIPVEYIPLTVEADPDFHIFRKVPAGDIIPTTSATRRGKAFATVLPPGDVHEEYASAQSVFETSFEEDERVVLVAGDVDQAELGQRSLLVLGEAVRDFTVREFLRQIDYPIRFSDNEGFSFDGTQYLDATHAVLCTIKHPTLDSGGITVIFANSPEAVPRGFAIPFYDRSLIVFENGTPILRHDFEARHVVAVDHQVRFKTIAN